MAKLVISMEIRKKEVFDLPEFTQFFLLDNGTIFSYQPSSDDIPEYRNVQLRTPIPRRIYVKWEGEEFDADLPQSFISKISLASHENALYFDSERKIYKASFVHLPNSQALVVEVQRDLLEDEELQEGGCFSRVVNGRTLVYKISDPEATPIEIDCAVVESMELRGVHRGQLIFTSPMETRVCKLSINSILSKPFSYMHDSFPFAFSTQSDGFLIAQDLTTFPVPKPIRIRVMSRNGSDEPIVIHQLLGICEGEVVLIAKRSEDQLWYLMTGTFPYELISARQAEAIKDQSAMEMEMALKEQQFQSTIDEQNQRIHELESIIESMTSQMTLKEQELQAIIDSQADQLRSVNL